MSLILECDLILGSLVMNGIFLNGCFDMFNQLTSGRWLRLARKNGNVKTEFFFQWEGYSMSE